MSLTSLDRALQNVRGFVLDLDGTTYLGSRLLPGSDRFLQTLRGGGVPHVFVTNNSSKQGTEYIAKLRGLGLDVDDGQVLTSGEATAMHLRRRRVKRVFVVGTPALEAEMRMRGLVLDGEDPETVVLGFDRTLTYEKLERATHLIRRGVSFIATHPDVVCPTENGPIPDCGSMIALLTASTAVRPVVVGKPEPLLAEMAFAKLDLPAHEVAVVGDRLYTDVAMARRAGAISVLVLSGETTTAMLADSDETPDLVVGGLGDLGQALERVTSTLAGHRPGGVRR